ncbi:Rrf2 family transcriptional regulator [Apibacter raozihei]|uniref:Rrf2 family transcriptional regulator n=1 Tax=Apibacter raozihei TaxID=2500547 RepID=UPI000FE2BAC2|nr:Rrf2 family transcriptional regulator [Apibacter raozihei]
MNDRHFILSMHILTLMAKNSDEWLSSEFISGSINVNPVLVRKELSNLSKHGFIQTKEGKNGGSRLNKPAEKIMLSEVYASVYNQTLLGKLLADPNPKCCVGKKINENINELSSSIEEVVLKQLHTQSLMEFSEKF